MRAPMRAIIHKELPVDTKSEVQAKAPTHPLKALFVVLRHL